METVSTESVSSTPPFPANGTAEPFSETAETYANVSFVLALLILTFSLLSFFTNFLSACVYSHRCMRSPINILLTGLSVIDILLSLLWIPAFVVPCLYVYFRSSLLKAAMSYSQVYVYPFTLMAHCASVWTFVVISLERMVAVLRPFRARWHSNRRSVCALILVVVMSAVYNSVRFFEFRISRNDDDPNEPIDTVPALRDSEQYPVYMALYYNGLFFVVQFLVPFTVLVVVNTLMIASIYRANAERRLLTIQQKREHRTAIMMAMTVLSFLICNTLQLILNAVELVNPDFFVEQSTLVLAFTLNDVCNLLIVFNTSCTALIYYFFCQKYRRVASELCSRVIKCTCDRKTTDFYSCSDFTDDARNTSRGPKLSQASAVRAHEARLLHSNSAPRMTSGRSTALNDQQETDVTDGLESLLSVSAGEAERGEQRRLSRSPCQLRSSYGRCMLSDMASAPPVMV